MTDRHKDQGPDLFVRGPIHERDPASKILRARDLQLKGFVIACLRALIANPDKLLTQLKPHWPEPKKPGRPPKELDAGGGTDLERERFEEAP